MWKENLILTVLITILFTGCGGNVQKGKFAVSSNSAYSLANDRGALAEINGMIINEDGNLIEKEIPLFYVLVILPEDKFTGLGTNCGSKTYETQLDLWWYDKNKPDKEAFRLAVKFDRKNDIINIFNTKFNRVDGNTFLIEFDKDMNPGIRRYGTINYTDNEKVMDYFKSNEKNNPEMENIFLFRK
jgi:hypothetical protein